MSWELEGLRGPGSGLQGVQQRDRPPESSVHSYMSYSLSSLKVAMYGIIKGEYMEFVNTDTRSSDYSSDHFQPKAFSSRKPCAARQSNT